MPIPLIALAAGAIGFEIRNRSRRQSAFNTALASFTHNPGGVGPPLDGSQTGAMLTPQQAAGLQDLYRSSPAAATTMLNQIQGRNQTAFQNTLTRELQWQQLGQARQTFQLTSDRFRVQQEQFAQTNDLVQIRNRKEAADLGAIYVNDPLNNDARTRTAAPGSVEWRELQNDALRTGLAAGTLNELIVEVGQRGTIRDRDAPGFGRQQALRRRLVGEIKDVLTLGALDAGVLEFTTGLVGDELAVGDFILGSDAATLERLLTTQGLFNNQMTLRAEDLRLLEGVNPALIQGFKQTQKESALLQQFITERIGNLQRAGGDVTDLIGRPGPTFLGDEARGGGVQLAERFAPPTAVGFLQESASVFGSQLDTITSGILGAILGRALPR